MVSLHSHCVWQRCRLKAISGIVHYIQLSNFWCDGEPCQTVIFFFTSTFPATSLFPIRGPLQLSFWSWKTPVTRTSSNQKMVRCCFTLKLPNCFLSWSQRHLKPSSFVVRGPLHWTTIISQTAPFRNIPSSVKIQVFKGIQVLKYFQVLKAF